jgi:hypothetical protein
VLLALLPFTLANVPMWLRPPSTGLGRRFVQGLCRIFALTMSATIALAAVGIFMDLVAWQCAAPGGRCVADRPWLGWLFTGFFEPTGRRLALATLGPVLAVFLLWYLGRRTWGRYEAYAVPRQDPDGEGLSSPSFWEGREQVSRLRGLHVAAMLGVVAAFAHVSAARARQANRFRLGVDLGGVVSADVVLAGDVLFWAAQGSSG